MAIDQIALNSFQAGGLAGALVALSIIAIIIVLALLIVYYILLSFAFMRVFQKAKTKPAGIAWIPCIGPAILASKTAKMHWWPILLLLGAGLPAIGGLFTLAFIVFFIIWMWKTFEKLNKPAWWSILLIIPIVDIILLFIAAKGKSKK